jgi:hypothetical protein
MNTEKFAQELCFISDMIGLINNHWEDIHEQTRNELMLLAAERTYSMHKEIIKNEARR